MQGNPDIIPIKLPGKATSSHPAAIGGDLWAAGMDSAYGVCAASDPEDWLPQPLMSDKADKFIGQASYNLESSA